MSRGSRRAWVEGLATRLLLTLNACSVLRVLASVFVVALASVVFVSARKLVQSGVEPPSPPSRTVVRSLPRVLVESPAEGSFTREGTIEIRGRLAGDDLAWVTCMDQRVACPIVLDGAFRHQVALEEGENRIVIAGGDLVGNSREASLTVVRDSTAPVIDLAFPPTEYVTREPRIEVRGRLDERWPARVEVQGEGVALGAEQRFARAVSLGSGENRIVLEGRDRAGNSCRMVLRVVLDQEAPVVTVTSPSEEFVTNKTSTTITCEVTDAHPAEVLVDGHPAKREARGNWIARVDFLEGTNSFEVQAVDAAGNPSEKVVVRIVSDRTVPTVKITSMTPADGGAPGKVTVAGTVSEDGCCVTVAGKEASVRGRTFRATVSHAEGALLIAAVSDRAGNEFRVARMWCSSATLKRFEGLVSGPGWGRPHWNASGTMEVEHERTGLMFVLVPAGSFRMGSDEGDADEKPVHEVKLGAFLLCKTECTQAAWDRVGGADDREWRGETLPIERVSWNDATAWCRKAGLRLPSESEWEYACRAGSTGKWCFGSEESKLKEYAEYGGNFSSGTRPVGGKKANGCGLHDMHGNVWEWCEDTWHGDYDGAPRDGSAWTTGGASSRVSRGGSFYYPASYCRSADRDRYIADYRRFYLGFRPAAFLP